MTWVAPWKGIDLTTTVDESGRRSPYVVGARGPPNQTGATPSLGHTLRGWLSCATRSAAARRSRSLSSCAVDRADDWPGACPSPAADPVMGPSLEKAAARDAVTRAA